MYKKFRLLILSILIISCLNSCVLATILIGTAVVAGGAVYYINGNYIIEIPRDLRTVYNATIKAIQMNNRYSLKNQSYTGKSATVNASEAGTNISIDLTGIKNRTTEIKIRYGALGDENKSANLVNEITKNID
ncbi:MULTISPECIES: DUF3568 family protein [unclassified Francisella]|uniref:DUF3568 family protein n=1 Tax=unclassified Francisella TaxID=2610885 RepID=UPI002E352D83|nr:MULTISPECIES: DUF3568 family protein [unclassified Francisella]MED7820372.1 DUF3568 family protein [Francisella sp. 19S2-4]MED7831207.1 DUF3568 family protein [Francisella sp. 19S2-10]